MLIPWQFDPWQPPPSRLSCDKLKTDKTSWPTTSAPQCVTCSLLYIQRSRYVTLPWKQNFRISTNRGPANMTRMTFLCIIALRNKTVTHTFSSMVLTMLNVISLSGKIEIQKFCQHGKVTSRFSWTNRKLTFFAFLGSRFVQIFGKILLMRVETLCNTNWQHQVIKNEKGTLPVDMRRSKTTLLGVS